MRRQKQQGIDLPALHTPTPGAETEVCPLLDPFREYLRAECRLSPETERSYLPVVRDWLQYLGTRLGRVPCIADLTLEAVRAYLSVLHDRLESSSIQHHLYALRAFFRFLLSRGLVSDNPAECIRPKKAPQKLPDILSIDQMEQLLSAPLDKDLGQGRPESFRDLLLLELIYGAGVRVAEVVGLNVTDVRHGNTLDDDGMLTLRVVGKGNKERQVPAGSKAREALDWYLPLRAHLGHAHLSTTQRYTRVDHVALLAGYQFHPRARLPAPSPTTTDEKE